MKFSRNVPPQEFVPVTITLESQAEVNLLTEFFGSITGTDQEAFGLGTRFTDPIYNYLADIATQRPHLKTARIDTDFEGDY